MKRSRHLIILLLLVLNAMALAQAPTDKDRLRKQRYSKIEFYHLAMGFDFSGNTNYRIVPKMSFGIGSFRNLVNAEIGIQYSFCNPLIFNNKEHLSPQYLSTFATTTLNFARWDMNSCFVGASAAYNLASIAIHHLPDTDLNKKDNHIGSDHFSVRVLLGTKIEYYDIRLFWEYDLAPAMNQKYVFESEEFDYDFLRPSLFERRRLGISFTYTIPLSL